MTNPPTDSGNQDLRPETPSDLGQAKMKVKAPGFGFSLTTTGKVGSRSWVALVVVLFSTVATASGMDALLHSSGVGHGWPAVGLSLGAGIVALVFGLWFLGLLPTKSRS